MLLLITTAVSACDRDSSSQLPSLETQEKAGDSAGGADAPRAAGNDSQPEVPLAETGKRAVDRLTRVTKRVPLTGWRPLSATIRFTAGRNVRPQIAVLTVEASKGILSRLWHAATSHASASTVTARAVREAAPVDPLLSGKVPSTRPSRGAVRALLDRVGAGEWLVASLVADALARDGAFTAGRVSVAPLTEDGLKQLTTAAERVLARVLEALRGKEDEPVTPEAVAQAARTTAESLGLTGSVSSDGTQSDNRSKGRRAFLKRLTRTYVRRRHAASAAGRAEDPFAPLRKALEAHHAAEWSRDQLDNFVQQAAATGMLLGLGLTPRRADSVNNPLVPLVQRPRDRVLNNRNRRSYGALSWVLNGTHQLLPRTRRPDGSLRFRYTGEAGFVSVASIRKEAAQTTVPAEELRAIRKSGMQWRILSGVWGRSASIAMDPLAVELLAERVAEHIALVAHFAEEEGPDAKNASNGSGGNRFALLQPPAMSSVQSATSERESVPLFKDVTEETGVAQESFVDRDNRLRSRGRGFNVEEGLGAGVAAGDFNGDGRMDLFLAGEGGNRLYKNVGGFRFKDVTSRVGIHDPKLTDARQALFADVNDDGRLDLLVVHYHSATRLFMQQPDGTFEDATERSGLDTREGALAAFFFDYDHDGLLDLYVPVYGAADTAPGGYPSLDARNGRPNQLFHNEGDGTFKEVSTRAGVDSTGWTLAGVAFDYNRDGWEDFYLANDFGADQLFENQGDGTFKDVAPRLGLDDRGAGMNASVVDVNRDGWWDLYLTTITSFGKNVTLKLPEEGPLHRIRGAELYRSGNKLMQNVRGNHFDPVEDDYFRRRSRGWCWGARWFDCENDGDTDMYLANGMTAPAPRRRDRNRLFLRKSNRFVEAGPDSSAAYRANTRGVVATDLDGDGRLDLVANNYDAGPTLLRNQTKTDYHWLKVRLEGRSANRFGVGCTVVAHVDGRQAVRRLVTCGDAFLASQPPMVHFGLGDAATIEGLTVHWPGDRTQKVPGPIEADQVLTVTQPRRRPSTAKRP